MQAGLSGVALRLLTALAGAASDGPTIMPTVKSGKLRALGVTSSIRSAAWPDVPTIREGGVAGYHTTQWHGVMVPRTTSPEVVPRLHQALVQTLQDPAGLKTLQADGAAVRGSTPEQFREFLRQEIAMNEQLARDTGGFRFE